MLRCWLLVLLLGFESCILHTNGASVDKEPADKTDRPIIGVLAQEISYHLDHKWPGVYESYIAASYIKFVEGGGARAVPIWIGKSRPYYEVMMSKVNGILFPGGGTWFNQTHGYAEAGSHIFDIAKELNNNGSYFPMFGTCLGFELLLFTSNQNKSCLANCSSQKVSLPLIFTEDFRESRMFGSAPESIINTLKNEPVTPNFHSFCLTRENLTEYDLEKQWKVLSYNYDNNGLEFVSSIEHKRYPFFGVQFHPEKNLYEWIPNRNISHSEGAIMSSQYFASFFVNECRKNGNKFTGIDEENRMLIYNFPTTFTGRVKSAFEQSYLFKSDVEYAKPEGSHYVNENDIEVVLM